MELERQGERSREGHVRTLFVGIVYDNDAVRQFTVQRPLDFVLAIDEGSNAASLVPRVAAGAREPRIAIQFEGNPDAGGVEVHSEGVAP